MKSTFYFDHDYNARNDQKILQLRAEYGWEGYGLYFAILENLCESKGYIKRVALGGLSLGLSKDKKEIEKFINFCINVDLLQEEIEGIYSKRILKHLDYRLALSQAGSKGGRGNKKEEIKPPFSLPKATLEAGKERKGEERKEKDNIKKEKPKFKIKKEILLSDVIKYFTENSYTLESATKFYNYYSVADWKDSKGNEVKNWKQKAQSVWFKPENEQPIQKANLVDSNYIVAGLIKK